jgi:hypothetical protein
VTDPDLLFRATDFDGSYPAFAWNSNKDLFSCTAKLRTIDEELIIVWLPFITAAFAIFVVLFTTLKRVYMTYRKQASTKKPKNAGSSGGSGDSRTASGALHQAGTNTEKKPNKLGCLESLAAFKRGMDKYGATKLSLLGFSAVVLVVILILTVVDTFPKMDNFTTQTANEYSCSITETADFFGLPCMDDVPTTCCYELCNPVLLGAAPDPTILGIGYYMSQSLIPLIFGLIFGLDQKHSTVWKLHFGIGKKVAASNGTMMSSSA